MTLNATEKFESLKITGSFKMTSFKFKLGVNSGAWDSILTNVNISVSQGEEIVRFYIPYWEARVGESYPRKRSGCYDEQ